MIDEKKLIKELEEWKSELNADYVLIDKAVCDVLNKVEDIINDQPQVGGWIPASERLPQEDGGYLCAYGKELMDVCLFSNDLFSIDDYDFAEYKFKKKKGFFKYDSEYGYFEVNWITAWMPLPNPYKENI